jgi:septum formation protein
MSSLPLILASSSQRRLNLLRQISIEPDVVISPDIDETRLKKENPRNLAIRLSKLKAEKIASTTENGYVLSADSVCACGNIVLPKAQNDEDVRYCLKTLSGRRHQVYTGVTIIKVQSGQIISTRNRIVKTIVKIKSLTDSEIEGYILSKEGIGKGGGFAISGIAEVFISFVAGSYSNIVGLPLFETRNMLVSLGYDIFQR